jgi:hypothetical protein
MTIHYFDSHGSKITFLVREENSSIALKRRKALYVLPEVVELIDRIGNSCRKEVALENVSCELCVHPVIIRSIFKYLQKTGLLGSEESLPKHEMDNHCILPEMKESWAGNVYPILRIVREEDYGTVIKPKEKKDFKEQTA